MNKGVSYNKFLKIEPRDEGASLICDVDQVLGSKQQDRHLSTSAQLQICVHICEVEWTSIKKHGNESMWHVWHDPHIKIMEANQIDTRKRGHPHHIQHREMCSTTSSISLLKCSLSNPKQVFSTNSITTIVGSLLKFSLWNQIAISSEPLKWKCAKSSIPNSEVLSTSTNVS